MPERRFADLLRPRHDERHGLLMALVDGPRTFEEIEDNFRSYMRLLGFPVPFIASRSPERMDDWRSEMQESLRMSVEQGWVAREGKLYVLTLEGEERARLVLEEVRRARRVLGRIVEPENVSKVSTAVHFGLAMLKLPAAILSGSIGLLNDGVDTLIDGLSSLMVYFGFRLNREREANVVLTFLMVCTAGFTLYEAVVRLLVPVQPVLDWFTFAATVISAAVCGGLYFYQRFVGVRKGSLSLITQSVDSRNHVIVAGSVTAGLLAVSTNLGLLDTLVGLGIALLISKSAVELVFELFRSEGEESVTVRYGIPLSDRYEEYRRTQMRDWMLYLAENGEVDSLEDLERQTCDAYDFSDNPMLRELGAQPIPRETITASIKELFERGWLEGEEEVKVTASGKEYLQDRLRHHRLFFNH